MHLEWGSAPNPAKGTLSLWNPVMMSGEASAKIRKEVFIMNIDYSQFEYGKTLITGLEK